MMGPEFPARLCIESAKASVVRCADKCQPARGRNRTAEARPPRVLLPIRKIIGNAQNRPPGDLAGIHIDGYELSPGRFSARKVFLRIPEANRSGKLTGIGVAAGFIRNNAHGLAQIVYVHYK